LKPARLPSAAFRAGARESFGVPSAVLGAGYFGFGALALESGFSLWLALLSTATIWALPGQLALVELHTIGASALVIVPAVMLTSARFLPMTMALMPVIRDRRHSRYRLYPAVHLLAMTGWTAAMRRCPELPLPQRLPYFVGFALVNWLVCLACTIFGYWVSGSLPHAVKLGLVFLTPVYFILILSGDVRHRLIILALAGGALAGPLIHLWTPQWSVLLGGLVGGSMAYLAYRLTRRHV
jgi:predicted branched-subunit amino acid permease